MAEGPVFALSGVGFSYGSAAVLSGIDLELAPGSFHAVLGPNGAGKSTLLDLLAGLKKPDQGNISFRGRPLEGFGRGDLARSISLIPQEYAVRFPFTVREVVLMGRHPHLPRFGPPGREDLDQVEQALAALDLESLAQKTMTALSGGEKQRVVLARCLAQDNSVILMDEPTANLDIRHALGFLELVRGLVRNEGRTVVAVMHDLNLAAQFCDQAAILEKGRLHGSGPVGRTLTEELLARVFRVEARVRPDDFTGADRISFRTGG